MSFIIYQAGNFICIAISANSHISICLGADEVVLTDGCSGLSVMVLEIRALYTYQVWMDK
jgi:hypothetical protein